LLIFFTIVVLRFHQQNDGKERITKPFAPFILIFTMTCEDSLEARKWEKYYKSSEGKRRLKSLVFD
jgi:putative endonuclease